jgi:hypothetical protein
MSHSARRSGVFGLLLLVGLLMRPTVAAAQSAIAGTVTDATGGVLPGVTVEARSPALIEQLRTGVTDDQGQYRIIDLRPGVYAVTFILPGFSTVLRDGIDLPADFTAPLNVQLRVGELAETVTVSGQSPVVDVQTTTRQQVISQELIQALPTGRTREAFMATVPAVRTSQIDVGGATQMDNGTATVYGGRGGDQNVTIDGMSVGSMVGDGSISAYIDNLPIQEYSVQTNAMGADIQTSGIQINMVPKTGGNRFTHEFVGLFGHNALLGNNISDAFLAKGIKPQKIAQAYDVDGSGGGPILQNKLWYFISARQWAFNTEVFNLYHTGAIQGREQGSPVVDGNLLRTAHGRLTAQVTPKNRLTVMNEHGWKNRDYQNVERGEAYPEALTRQNSPNTQLAQAKWTSTVTNKLLLEAGWSFNHFDQSNLWPVGLPVPTVENPFLTIRRVDLRGTPNRVANLPYGAPQLGQSGPSLKHWYTSMLTYITGTHALKGGFQFQKGFARISNSVPPSPELGANMMQRYISGVPNSVVLYNLPRESRNDMVADLGLFIQDTWTRGRLTLNPGLRYDYFHGRVPEQTAGAGRWVPARTFPAVENVPLWHDVTPRLGVAYDLFGTGKTAIKGSFGTYLWKSYTGIAARYNLMLADTDTRDWTDLNRNDIADPNELGPSTNLSFGLPKVQRRLDPDLRRERTRLYNVSLDHELRPGLGVSVAYNRRRSYDIGVLDNLATTLDDYTRFTIADPRGNGQEIPGYYLNRNKLGIIDQIDTTSDANTRYYNGFDLNVRGRLGNGAQFYAGSSTGHLIETMCDVEDPNWLRFCDQTQYDIPWLTLVKVSGVYPIWRGIKLAAVFQRLPFQSSGSDIQREYTSSQGLPFTFPITRALVPGLTTASIACSPPPSVVTATPSSCVGVRVNEPGTEYLPAVNQLDISVSSSFSMGKVLVRPVFDVFNALNVGTVLEQSNVYGPSLGDPRRILFPRVARFGARIEF